MHESSRLAWKQAPPGRQIARALAATSRGTWTPEPERLEPRDAQRKTSPADIKRDA
jgi:hypothetical protein